LGSYCWQLLLTMVTLVTVMGLCDVVLLLRSEVEPVRFELDVLLSPPRFRSVLEVLSELVRLLLVLELLLAVLPLPVELLEAVVPVLDPDPEPDPIVPITVTRCPT